MIVENIYLAILVAAIATYFSRGSGVIFSKKIKVDSKVFHLISYISIGVIVAIISRIIIYPKGILAETNSLVRYCSVLVLILSYFITKKNVILSTSFSCFVFYLLLKI